MLNLTDAMVGSEVALDGWLVDRKDGLFLLDNHYPEDINYPLRVKFVNGDVMYPVLARIPSLAGGVSLIFCRARIFGTLIGTKPLSMIVGEMTVEEIRGSGKYVNIDISTELVNEYVAKRGKYKFWMVRPSARDWLED
ncbi:hypothetical protein [Cupriavidus sp. DL-D2]|uniref:hypothetical protein n=1 Tax=Cupriavidus sp. DL-D2 TaxID=3144974 RepID=UPI003212518F